MSTKVTITLTIARAGHKRTEQWSWEEITAVDEDDLVTQTAAHAVSLELHKEE